MKLTDIADELYGVALDEFTAERNRHAAALRAEDKALAASVKQLPKPSLAAWVVNQMMRHHAEQMQKVLALGESLRAAQADLDPEALRELSRQRRQLTAAVTTQGRALAAELGHRVTDAVATQVEETLRAAMVDKGAADAVRTGQLVGALSATGVGEADVARSVAVPESIGQAARPATRPTPTLSVVPEPERSAADARRERDEQRRRAREEAEAVLAEAEDAAARAEKKRDKAIKRVAKLEARSLQLQAELEEVRRRAGELEHELEVNDDTLSEAEDARDQAEERKTEADAAVEEARAKLDPAG